MSSAMAKETQRQRRRNGKGDATATAAAVSHAQGGSKNELLILDARRMFEIGAFSDLTIETSTKSFKVHKSVVCEANDFFKAAGTSGFLESSTNCIKLPETEQIVESLLRCFYEFDAEDNISNLVNLESMLTAGAAGVKRVTDFLIDIVIAADKYGVPSLAEIAGAQFYLVLFALREMGDHKGVVDAGCLVFGISENLVTLKAMRCFAALMIGFLMPTVVLDTDAFVRLCDHKQWLQLANLSALSYKISAGKRPENCWQRLQTARTVLRSTETSRA